MAAKKKKARQGLNVEQARDSYQKAMTQTDRQLRSGIDDAEFNNMLNYIDKMILTAAAEEKQSIELEYRKVHSVDRDSAFLELTGIMSENRVLRKMIVEAYSAENFNAFDTADTNSSTRHSTAHAVIIDWREEPEQEQAKTDDTGGSGDDTGNETGTGDNATE